MPESIPSLMVVIGTRPEAIKLIPIVKALESYADKIRTTVCVTAQHRDMLDSVLNLFGCEPHIDLNIMKLNQSPSSVFAKALEGIQGILDKTHQDCLVIQGDTTTTAAAAMAAYHSKVPIAHVEAGLRTWDKAEPFPEEVNRRIVTSVADFHFAPTTAARDNLIKDHISRDNILVTGNTAIDALLLTAEAFENKPISHNISELIKWRKNALQGAPYILATLHRRENFESGIQNACEAIRELCIRHSDTHWIMPLHPNPKAGKTAEKVLSGQKNVHLIKNQTYDRFVYLMKHCVTILTDSGGVQEEAPSLGKHVFVARNCTERTEGVHSGTATLTGTDTATIIDKISGFLSNGYRDPPTNPYGDGNAAHRIVQFLAKSLPITRKSRKS